MNLNLVKYLFSLRVLFKLLFGVIEWRFSREKPRSQTTHLLIQIFFNLFIIIHLNFLEIKELVFYLLKHAFLDFFQFVHFFNLSKLTVEKLLIFMVDFVFKSNDLINILVTLENVLIFGVRESDNLKIFLLTSTVKQQAEFFHELKALLA